MAIEAYCTNPSCNRRSLLPKASAGRPVRCKACGRTFVAGGSETVAAGAAGPSPAGPDLEPPWDAVPPRAAPPPSSPSSAGGTVGRFVIRGKLGAGAFGTVYRAYDPQLDRVVALKVPNPGVMSDEKRAERFLREAKAAAHLHHPHIVPVFDAGRDGDRYYIASAFIDGTPLSDGIPEGGADFPRAARLARELAEALAYAHGQGVVHRDVKPQNVMVDPQDRVHLMDFGLAARQEEAARLTNDGAVLGTPAYMAPEQAAGQKGEARPAADQYAAGVVLYELLTGRVPFAGPVAAVIHSVLHADPDPPRLSRPDVPRDLETICLKALSKRPEDRYPDCRALADDLRRWQEGEPITARALGFRERAVRWVKREPKLSAAVLVTALALIVSIGLVSAAAGRADDARQQAEKDAADARSAEKVAEDALAAARAAEEREGRATAGELGALGTARDERKKAEGFRVETVEWRKKAEALQGRVEAEQTNGKALQAKLAPVERRVLQAAFLAFQDGTVEDADALLQTVPADRRGWEWRHVQKLCAPPADKPPVRSLKLPLPAPVAPKGRTTDATLVEFSLDGGRVVTGSRDGAARVWDANTGDELRVLTHARGVRPVAFGPDGGRVVTVGGDFTARVWNANTGAELRVLGEPVDLRKAPPAPDAFIMSAVLSPDGRRVATTSLGPTARVWDMNTGAEPLVLKGHTALVHSAAFSPDGRRVITAGGDNTARVWDANTGAELLTLDKLAMNPRGGPTGVTVSAAYSRDGRRLVTAGRDAKARVWDADTGAELLDLKHTVPILTAVFNPDGTRIATKGADESAGVWDATTGATLLRIKYPSPLASVNWSSDGSKLLVGLQDGTIEVRDGG